jgi:hypothetical protein
MSYVSKIYHFGDADADGRIPLKLILKKQALDM